MNAMTLLRTHWFTLTLNWRPRPAAQPAAANPVETQKKPSRVVRIAGLR